MLLLSNMETIHTTRSVGAMCVQRTLVTCGRSKAAGAVPAMLMTFLPLLPHDLSPCNLGTKMTVY